MRPVLEGKQYKAFISMDSLKHKKSKHIERLGPGINTKHKSKGEALFFYISDTSNTYINKITTDTLLSEIS